MLGGRDFWKSPREKANFSQKIVSSTFKNVPLLSLMAVNAPYFPPNPLRPRAFGGMGAKGMKKEISSSNLKVGPLFAGAAMLFLFTSCFDSSTDRNSRDPVDGGDAAETGVSGQAGNGGRSPSNYTQLRNEKRDLEARLKELKELQERQGELVREELEASSQLESARLYLNEMTKLEEEVERALEQWRTQTRGSFVGVQLSQVTMIGGETFEQVEILGVTDSHLRVRHSGGVAELEIMQLPVSLRVNVIHEATVLATQ